MKVCFVADTTSVLVQIWVKFFAERGHDVTILAKDYVRIPGTKVYTLNFFSFLKGLPFKLDVFFRNIFFYPFIVFKLRKIKPDLINSIYLFPYGLYTAYSFCNVPKVMSVWGSDVLVLAKRYSLFRFLAKKCFEKFDLVQADSKEIMEWSLKFGCPKNKMLLLVIPGVDTRLFKTRRKGFSKTIISTRSFSPVYDIETTLRSFSLVLKKHKDAKLLIAGSGMLGKNLKKVARELGINKNIAWLGKLPHNEIIKYLSMTSIYVSTSLSDSTSVSLLEAMSSSLPIVVSDAPANLEWVKHGFNGFIFNRKDCTTAAKYLIKLIENPKLSMKFGKRSREIILQKADYMANFKKFEREFKKLIG
jgi:glycosyltransferase involved in cell wall biosynthesis